MQCKQCGHAQRGLYCTRCGAAAQPNAKSSAGVWTVVLLTMAVGFTIVCGILYSYLVDWMLDTYEATLATPAAETKAEYFL